MGIVHLQDGTAGGGRRDRANADIKNHTRPNGLPLRTAKSAVEKETQTPAEVKKNKEGHFPKVIPSTILETHFHIVVVSPKFDRLSQHERLEVVYEAILQECGQQLQGTLPTINHALDRERRVEAPE